MGHSSAQILQPPDSLSSIVQHSIPKPSPTNRLRHLCDRSLDHSLGISNSLHFFTRQDSTSLKASCVYFLSRTTKCNVPQPYTQILKQWCDHRMHHASSSLSADCMVTPLTMLTKSLIELYNPLVHAHIHGPSCLHGGELPSYWMQVISLF